jgi:hypothetical protein
MAKLSKAAGDPALIKDGVWVEHELGFKFKIRRMPNPEYNRMRQRLMQPLLRKSRRRTVDLDATEMILKKCVAHTVLVDWDEVDDDNDKPIPFSHEEAERLLIDPSFQDLYDFLLEEAQDLANFTAEAREDEAKNSAKS